MEKSKENLKINTSNSIFHCKRSQLKSRNFYQKLKKKYLKKKQWGQHFEYAEAETEEIIKQQRQINQKHTWNNKNKHAVLVRQEHQHCRLANKRRRLRRTVEEYATSLQKNESVVKNFAKFMTKVFQYLQRDFKEFLTQAVQNYTLVKERKQVRKF